MPFYTMAGSSLSATNSGAQVDFSSSKVGIGRVTFELDATPVGGGTEVLLDTFDFSRGLLSGANGFATANFEYDASALPNGNYDFRVVATQPDRLLDLVAPAPDSFDIITVPNVEIVCFLAGTMIATPAGEVPVETLTAGDLVVTADGCAVPVLWLGRQTVSTLFGMPEGRQPVCIAAGALGGGLPRRDLRVTAGHALLIDGVLVNAGAMVNGLTITRIPPATLGSTFTVFHIETEYHEIILAEGAASETFIDNISRARFDNHAEFVAMFGSEGRPIEEMDQPHALSARQLPAALRTRLAAQMREAA